MKRLAQIVAAMVCVVLAAPGCAMREYEARMDDQRRRLEIFDEENRFIGSGWIGMPMIEVPAKEGSKDSLKVPAWPFEVFLRPPKEVFTAAAATVYQSPAQDLRLFRYPATTPGYNFFIAAGLVADKEKTKDGRYRVGEYTIEDFRDRVRGACLDYYRKEYKFNPPGDFLVIDPAKLQKIPMQPITDRGAPLPSFDYEALAFKDTFNHAKEPAIIQVYLYQHPRENKQVAIIVQFPATWMSDDSFKQAINWSLKTLDVTQAGIAVKRNALMNRR
jgi:hypothetical protein